MIRSASFRWSIIALIFLISIVTAAVSLYVYMHRQGVQLQSTYQLIADKEALAAELQTTASMVAETQIQREELRSYIVVGNDGIVSLLSSIDQLAADLGVSIETTSLNVEEEKKFSTLIVQLSLQGAEESVLNMVRLLETLPTKSHLEQLALTREISTATGQLTVNGQITLHTSIIEYDQ